MTGHRSARVVLGGALVAAAVVLGETAAACWSDAWLAVPAKALSVAAVLLALAALTGGLLLTLTGPAWRRDTLEDATAAELSCLLPGTPDPVDEACADWARLLADRGRP